MEKVLLSSVNVDIGGDLVQDILWHAGNMVIPKCTQIMITHCGTNDIDHNDK